jgi:DNA polymerase-3 subunit alpha
MYDIDFNKRAVESLIRCGALDSLGANRAQMTAMLEPLAKDLADRRRRDTPGQMDMFGELSGEAAQARIRIPDIPDFSPSEKMNMEHEVTGIYLSGHPADAYRASARAQGALRIGAVLADFSPEREEGGARLSDGDEIRLLGAVASVRTKITKNNTQMAYVTLDDGTGTIEALVFQRVLNDAAGYLLPGTVLFARGRVSARDEKTPVLMADALAPADRSAETGPSGKGASGPRSIYVKADGESDPRLARLDLILTMFPGGDRLVAVVGDKDSRERRKLPPRAALIHDALLKELREMFGEGSVAVK